MLLNIPAPISIKALACKHLNAGLQLSFYYFIAIKTLLKPHIK